VDLFVVREHLLRLLYSFIIVLPRRRGLVWSRNDKPPRWIARQLTGHFPWTKSALTSPDRDHLWRIVTPDYEPMGIREHHSTILALAERLATVDRIDPARCVAIYRLGPRRNLLRILRSYARLLQRIRTHVTGTNCPSPRPGSLTVSITSNPILGGLHRRYVRV